MLSRTGLCVGLITPREETYRVCGVSDCESEGCAMVRGWGEYIYIYIYIYIYTGLL